MVYVVMSLRICCEVTVSIILVILKSLIIEQSQSTCQNTNINAYCKLCSNFAAFHTYSILYVIQIICEVEKGNLGI